MKPSTPYSGRPATLVPYLLAFSISWALVGLLVLWAGNANLFLALNGLGNPWLDRLFGPLTWMGDGIFFAIACCLLVAWHRRSGLASFAAFGLSSGLAQLLKRVFFDGWQRPKAFFADRQIEIYQPGGVELFSYNSFPSGHTTSAFCLACLLAYFFPTPRVQVAVLVLAWGVGLSRIMQAQHFPLDVLAGAMVGTAAALVVRDVFFKWRWPTTTLGRPKVPKP